MLLGPEDDVGEVLRQPLREGETGHEVPPRWSGIGVGWGLGVRRRVGLTVLQVTRQQGLDGPTVSESIPGADQGERYVRNGRAPGKQSES
ncbi:hypothetical protein GCM10009737_27030 [Nocardioides lentus]|uniref:Uncharacterized protein n=1 Tax=Nocardioides lentus TaxID=338077 RepID=A0ABP5AXW9_9ACTN